MAEPPGKPNVYSMVTIISNVVLYSVDTLDPIVLHQRPWIQRASNAMLYRMSLEHSDF